MKLLTKDQDNQYLQALKQLLESNGIPAVIQGENTARMLPPFQFYQAGLWVYLDHQLEDAVKLMMDPNHQVTTGIDMEAFYKSRPSEEAQNSSLNKALIDLAFFVIAICFGVFALIKILELISA